MKWLKKVLIAFLFLILVNCIFFLAISFNLKKILINGVIKETIVEQLIPRSYSSDNKVITDEQIKEITDDPRIQEILNSPEVQSMMEEYLDNTVEGLIDENNIDEVALEEDMARFIKENRSIIEEKVGREITDEMIDKAMEQIETKDISNAYRQSVANASRNMTKSEKQVLKGYKFIISSTFKFILLIIMLIDLILIALLQKSLYKWIGTLATASITSGVALVLASIVSSLIVKNKTNINFNTSSLTTTGIIIAVCGIVILVIYKVILKLVKKDEKLKEIPEFSEEDK